MRPNPSPSPSPNPSQASSSLLALLELPSFDCFRKVFTWSGLGAHLVRVGVGVGVGVRAGARVRVSVRPHTIDHCVRESTAPMVCPNLDIQISFWKGLSIATCIVVFMTASICAPKGI